MYGITVHATACELGFPLALLAEIGMDGLIVGSYRVQFRLSLKSKRGVVLHWGRYFFIYGFAFGG